MRTSANSTCTAKSPAAKASGTLAPRAAASTPTRMLSAKASSRVGSIDLNGIQISVARVVAARHARRGAGPHSAFMLIAASAAAPKKKIAFAAQSGSLGSRGILSSMIMPTMAITMPASCPMVR